MFPLAWPHCSRAEGERHGLPAPGLSLRPALLSAQSAGPPRQVPASLGARIPSLPGSTVTGEVMGWSNSLLSDLEPFPASVSPPGEPEWARSWWPAEA